VINKIIGDQVIKNGGLGCDQAYVIEMIGGVADLIYGVPFEGKTFEHSDYDVHQILK
jgi:hypothetical protein